MTQAQTLDARDIAKMSNEELSRLEREIARRHIEGLSWFMVAWPFANHLLAVALAFGADRNIIGKVAFQLPF